MKICPLENILGKRAFGRGQALLIILLVMAVVLTVGLSVISRSVTDVRLSQQEEESARAFSVAEAGIEEALGRDLPVGGFFEGSLAEVDYTVSAKEQGNQPCFDFGGSSFVEGDIQTVWLVEHRDGQPDHTAPGRYDKDKIHLYWGAGSVFEPTALEASLFYYDNSDGSYKVAREGFGEEVAGFSPASSVCSVDCGEGEVSFHFCAEFSFGLSLNQYAYALRLKLLKNNQSHPILVKGDETNLPSQGVCYVSTATVPESGITRKVQQCQSHPVLPDIFDYVLVSKTALEK